MSDQRARPETPEDDELTPIEEVGEPFDVGRLHASVWHEHEEPRDGHEPVPTWLSLLFGAIVFYGGFYTARYAADFRPDVYDGGSRLGQTVAPELPPVAVPATEAELISLGRRVYRNCVPCHELDGQSQAPYPPLAGSEWVVGETSSAGALIRMTLYGVSGPMVVAGKEYDAQMPGYADRLRDYEIAAVLTFIRNEWGNQGEAIFPDAVAEVRRELGVRGPFRADELSGGQ